MTKWKLFTKNKNPALIQDIKTKAKRDGSKKIIGFQYNYFKFDRGGLYAEPDHQKEFINFVKNKFKENYKLFFDIIKKEKADSSDLIKFSEKIKNINLKGKSNKELMELLNEFSDKFEMATSYLMMHVVMDFAVQERLEDILKKKIKNKIKFDDYLAILFSLDRETETAKSTKELLKSAVKLNKKESVDKDIERFLKKYSWLNLEDGYGKLFTKDMILKRINEMARAKPKDRLSKLNNDLTKIKKRAPEIISELSFSSEEKDIYNLMQELIYRRAALNEELNIAGFDLIPFFDELAKRLKLKYDELFYLTKKELNDSIKNNKIPNKELIKERQQGYAIILEAGNISIYSGKELGKIKTEEEDYSKLKEVKGRSACQGFARGYAKIVKNISDIEKVEQGDILVTDSLTPDYIMATEKSQAIVADVGGVTSHAAIISRELGIPCVIGTKIATKVFRDGELIEVDANKGIAKKV